MPRAPGRIPARTPPCCTARCPCTACRSRRNGPGPTACPRRSHRIRPVLPDIATSTRPARTPRPRRRACRSPPQCAASVCVSTQLSPHRTSGSQPGPVVAVTAVVISPVLLPVLVSPTLLPVVGVPVVGASVVPGSPVDVIATPVVCSPCVDDDSPPVPVPESPQPSATHIPSTLAPHQPLLLDHPQPPTAAIISSDTRCRQQIRRPSAHPGRSSARRAHRSRRHLATLAGPRPRGLTPPRPADAAPYRRGATAPPSAPARPRRYAPRSGTAGSPGPAVPCAAAPSPPGSRSCRSC
jgi:hypothetical protein